MPICSGDYVGGAMGVIASLQVEKIFFIYCYYLSLKMEFIFCCYNTIDW